VSPGTFAAIIVAFVGRLHRSAVAASILMALSTSAASCAVAAWNPSS